jgi:23S rRNA (adenine1618-N6)-methyltransferase
MSGTKKEHPKVKSGLHPRNKHRERYDFKLLIKSDPELARFVRPNEYGDESVDFFNPKAVKALNKALLYHFYDIDAWDIPPGYLCPPIPGRADYIHHMADVLAESNNGVIPRGKEIKCLDIGMGSNCIYPIIGTVEYGWSFVGSDIDTIAIDAANAIIASNQNLKDTIEIRWQKNPNNSYHDIIRKGERFDLSICNPPFYSSKEDALAATDRKNKNLKAGKLKNISRNFAGKNNELWCEGGEKRFVRALVRQSKLNADACLWFSSLVSKGSNLKSIKEALAKVEAVDVKVIPMGQGNKISRIVAWTFHDEEKRKSWYK